MRRGKLRLEGEWLLEMRRGRLGFEEDSDGGATPVWNVGDPTEAGKGGKVVVEEGNGTLEKPTLLGKVLGLVEEEEKLGRRLLEMRKGAGLVETGGEGGKFCSAGKRLGDWKACESVLAGSVGKGGDGGKG